jgi:hypothetical protein
MKQLLLGWILIGLLGCNHAWSQTLLRGRLTTNDATWQNSPLLVGLTATNASIVSNLTVAGAAIYALQPSTNITFATNGSTIAIAANGGGGGGNTFNCYTNVTTLVDSTATPFVEIGCGTSKFVGVSVFFTTRIRNGSIYAVASHTFNLSVIDDGTMYYINVSPTAESINGNSTLPTVTFDAIQNAGGTFSIRATATGYGSGTTLDGYWHIWVHTDDAASTVTPL